MSIFKMKFYFCILPRLYISTIIEQLTNKVQVFVRKKRLTVNLNIWVKLNELRQNHGWKSWFCSIVIYPFYENILIKRWTFWNNVIVYVNFKEYSDKALCIFWKSPYRKNQELLKWNNSKIDFFSFSDPPYFWFL